MGANGGNARRILEQQAGTIFAKHVVVCTLQTPPWLASSIALDFPKHHRRHRRHLARQHAALHASAHHCSRRDPVDSAPRPRPRMCVPADLLLTLPHPLWNPRVARPRPARRPGCERSFRFGVQRCQQCREDMCGGTTTPFERRLANCDSKTNNSRSSQSAVFDP